MGFTLPKKLCRERAVDQGATRRVTPLNALSLHYFHRENAWIDCLTMHDSIGNEEKRIGSRMEDFNEVVPDFARQYLHDVEINHLQIETNGAST
jgi:hypothetical protein